VLFRELPGFGGCGLQHRLRNGGLPENLLRDGFPEKDFAEWMDAFWARDIQELFRLEKRNAFMKLFELLLLQSGQLCELNAFTSPCGASHPTLQNYLSVLEATGVMHVLRPYAKNRKREIVAMPKVYGFDTGFVCFGKGWRDLRQEDLGLLWEHLVLDELLATFGPGQLHHWRDKQKHEVDFVLARHGRPPVAIECKWRLSDDAGRNFRFMRNFHPDVQCLVVAANAKEPVRHPNGWIETGLGSLAEAIHMLSGSAPD
jgi:predicted AAA+ superfamily ATPase